MPRLPDPGEEELGSDGDADLGILDPICLAALLLDMSCWAVEPLLCCDVVPPPCRSHQTISIFPVLSLLNMADNLKARCSL